MGKYICSKVLSLVTEKNCKINLWCSEVGFYDLILKLPDMVKLKTAEIMCKAFNNSLPNNIHKLFLLYDFMTRQNCVCKQKYARTNLKTMCISFNCVKLWNSLDSSLIHCKSVHLFKKNYVVQVLHSYITNE